MLPNNPKEAAAIRRKASRFYYNAIMNHCITDRMMESYSDAFHIKRHGKRSKKLMMVCVKLTNPDPSSKTGLEDLAIIG